MSTQETTVQITNINTLANFQILNWADFIELDIEMHKDPEEDTVVGTYKILYPEPHVGMAWEAVSGVINTMLRNEGIEMTVSIGDLRKLCFVSNEEFQIRELSYNFEVLLGFTGVKYPVRSHTFEQWVGRRTTSADPVNVTNFTLAENWTVYYPTIAGGAPEIVETYTAANYEMSPYSGSKYANRWSIQWSIIHWVYPEGKQDWCTIDPNTGTIHLLPDLEPDVEGGMELWETHSYYCIVQAKVFDGGPVPLYRREAGFHAYHGKVGPPDELWYVPQLPPHIVMNKPTPTLMFGESATVSLKPTILMGNDTHPAYQCAEYTKVLRWYLSDMNVVKFNGRFRNEVDWSHAFPGDTLPEYYLFSADDVGQSVPLIALSEAGTANLLCECVSYPNGINEVDKEVRYIKMTITVINDLVTATRWKLEAPAVGNPLSTPQLYLMSNIGSQVYQNKLTTPDFITNAQVSATIQNTFSAGYSISASGDAPVQVSTASLNNLTFELVDANFSPIALLNPMYITISATPVPISANNDLSQFTGKMPKDAPTRAEKAQAEADAKVQADAQAQADAQTAEANAEAKRRADIQNLAFELIVQVLTPIAQQQMIEQQVAMAKMQEQQIKEGVAQHLLQDPTVQEFISTLPEHEVVPFVKKLVKQVIKQGVEQAQAEAPQPMGVPTGQVITEQPIVQPPTDQPAEAETQVPAETPIAQTIVQPTTDQPAEAQPETATIDDLPISGQL
jgi:hypothetical protein